VHLDRPHQTTVAVVYEHSLTSASSMKHMSPLVTNWIDVMHIVRCSYVVPCGWVYKVQTLHMITKETQLNKYQESVGIKSKSLQYFRVYPHADSLLFFILYLGILNFCLVCVFCSEPNSWVISLKWQRGRFCECYVSAVVSRAVTSIIQWWFPDRHISTGTLCHYIGNLCTLLVSFVSVFSCYLLERNGLCVYVCVRARPHLSHACVWFCNLRCTKYNFFCDMDYYPVLQIWFCILGDY
jgi:hypothetical protein